jgi:hypothetical protein
MLWLVAIGILGGQGCYAENIGDVLFAEEIPKQKMVMSRQRPKATALASAEATSGTLIGKTQQHAYGVEQEDVAMSVQEAYSSDAVIEQEQTGQMHASQKHGQYTQVDSDKSEQTRELYQIIPEQGQAPPKPYAATQKTKKPVIKQVVSDAVAYSQIMNWASEVSMSMFTYSGAHLHRDQNYAAQYFSPEAWQVVKQFLFQRAESPFLSLHRSTANSRGMTLDWPISLDMDITKRGKVWWVKVPVSAVIKDVKTTKRAVYEVKLGVVPMMENSKQRFIAQEVSIKQINLQEKKQPRSRRHGR